MNAAHPIPSRDIFYRLFEGKKTTVTQMYDKFTDKLLANHPPDYVKIANILVVYRILFCHDPSRAIDGWVWALVKDVDAWNSFPWGSYTFQMLMHFMSLIPRAYEVFPELGRRLGVVGGQLTTPRCLKWSFSSRSVDFSRFFYGQLNIQLMVPSADELLRPYFQSLEGDSVLGMRYFVPRAKSKKKLLTNVACRVIPRTYTRSSDVVGPSRPQHGVGERALDEDRLSDPKVSPPRASRPKRPMRTEEESSREPEMPRRCPGELFDSWFDRFVDVIAGAIEDRVMRRVGQMFDIFSTRIENLIVARLCRSPTPPLRGPTPPQRADTASYGAHTALQGAHASQRAHTAPSQRTYAPQRAMTPRMRGDKSRGGRSAGRSSVGQSSAARSSTGDLFGSCLAICPSREIIVDFILEVGRQLRRQQRTDVVVCSTHLFTSLQRAWASLHPDDIEYRYPYGDDRYLWWNPPDGMMDIIKGLGGVCEGPWAKADYVITICNVGGHHWVTVHICLRTWTIELYDSLLFNMDDPNDIEVAEKRDRELVPLLCLLTRLLWSSGYWGGWSRPNSHFYALKLDKSIPDQFMQFDGVSYGVYAMMYVDRLLFGVPHTIVSEDDIRKYRYSVAVRIYSLSYTRRPQFCG
ncbi:hypothetical protein C2S52_013529 [Perilla frutescens var. hirtella]|nr:hypothetical protein C2S52_013529 [Perilla frutescens var. hirtella]